MTEQDKADAQDIYDHRWTEARDTVCDAVDAALTSAVRKHRSIYSAHEGYAVILEELDEVKAEVWKSTPNRAALYKELQHVAAMAIRMAIDLVLYVPDEENHVSVPHVQ